ncbi:KpsF/GutQ family sugar-phosphate isomerase [Permianibacter aggregans]|uniref:Arabinose 5-phosphate isomerase n=1 Tax=Permianibacter aggregans TaxID=1510150 RepID=A0A4V3D754_9GAMM|nr:KpsF/GutQ family sugar-phosphate isomerase [Permianibacter aggregans]QGX40673.1 KpsF/GutQ family sugar-phosphate isomerase [Permianibacter aggregans]TDQ46547.1 arabinose-5-phosphate isomerase [Permianibacter aggregans]
MSETSKPHHFAELGKAVLDIEIKALEHVKSRLDGSFNAACEKMLACQGRIVVLGMGKSGHIGGKVAATLASTGTPAFFVHPGEASHGDLGMITEQDVVLAFSNSGETDEILMLLPVIKRRGVPLVALTGRPGSTLAQAADVHVYVGVEKEACPLGLAPTASTTAALAMGDALAVALLEARGFTAEDFALSHPAGALGRRLLLHVEQIMHGGEAVPKVRPDDSLKTALLEMSRKRLGMTTIVDESDHLLGIFTDGDLRRTLEKNVDLAGTKISEVMTKGGKTTRAKLLAAEAMRTMEQYAIGQLVVVDDENRVVGALNMHDLLKAGVV